MAIESSTPASVQPLVRGHTTRSWLMAWQQKAALLARRRSLAVLLVGVLALGIRAALLPLLPIPKPRFQDEFSYLLAARNPQSYPWHWQRAAILQRLRKHARAGPDYRPLRAKSRSHA